MTAPADLARGLIGPLGAAGAVLAFVTAVFGLGPDSAFVTSYDFREYMAGNKALFAAAVGAGRLPLWDPHILGGWPFLANPEAQVFYPASLLYLLLPVGHAATADLAAHLLLAWLGAAFLARRSLGLGGWPAAFAGLAYATSGFFVSHGYAGHLTLLQAAAYIPWLVAVAERICAAAVGHGGLREIAGWSLAGALLAGLQLLSGGVQMAWLGAIAAGLTAVTGLLLNRAAPRAWCRSGLALAALALLGAGLAMVQLLPSAELAALSNRPRHDYGYASVTSLEPSFLVTAVAPRLLLDAWSGIPWHEYYAYAGLLPLGFAVVGLIAGAGDRRVLMLLPAAAFMAAYMLGTHGWIHRPLFDWVPTFDLFRAPARAIGIVHLVVALLAGAGLQWLLGRSWRDGALPAVAVIVTAAITLADVAAAARWYQTALRGPANNAAAARDNLRIAESNSRPLRQDATWYRYWASPAMLPHNFARQLDRRSIGGYSGIILQRYQNFVGYMSGYGLQSLGVALLEPRIQARAPPFPFKVLGVKYELTRGQLHERPGGPDVPRGWFVAATRPVAGEIEALRYMRSAAFRPLHEAVVEADVAVTPRGGTPHGPVPTVAVGVGEDGPEKLVIEVGGHPAGLLVLSEIYYPGWTASDASAAPLPVMQCDAILRCIGLDASARPQRIVMEYRPFLLRLGAALSATTLVVMAIAWVLAGRSQRAA